jgi:hypothetical protein
MGDRASWQTRDTIIDAMALRHGVQLRVEYRPFRGQHYIDIRRWHLDGGVWYPDSGLAVRSHDVAWLVRALGVAGECTPPGNGPTDSHAPRRHQGTPRDGGPAAFGR